MPTSGATLAEVPGDLLTWLARWLACLLARLLSTRARVLVCVGGCVPCSSSC